MHSAIGSQSRANFLLQAANLLAKVTLAFTLARFLSVVDFGLFGLLSSTLTCATLAAGLEFSSFSARELVKSAPCDVPRLIRDQFVLHVITYGLLAPLILFLFLWGFLPWGVVGPFYLLILLEHCGQELGRVLIILGRPTLSVTSSLLRQGMWVYGLVVLFFMKPQLAHLSTVCWAWIGGELVAAMVAFYALRQLPWKSAWAVDVDWSWLRRGIHVALPLLIATLALAGISMVDRLAIHVSMGDDPLGIYTFYMQVRNATQSLVEAAVIILYQPRIIMACQQSNRDEFQRLMRKMICECVAVTGILLIPAAVLLRPALRLLNLDAYAEFPAVFCLVLVLTVVSVLCGIGLFGLYAQGRDRAMITCTVRGFAVALVLNLWLVPWYGLIGAATATAIAMSVAALSSSRYLAQKDFRCA